MPELYKINDDDNTLNKLFTTKSFLKFVLPTKIRIEINSCFETKCKTNDHCVYS
jgi:hypothetical protein